jgi:SAM-dependent methyltransferase
MPYIRIMTSCNICHEKEKQKIFGKGYSRCGNCLCVYSTKSFSEIELKTHYAGYYHADNTLSGIPTLLRYREIVESLAEFRRNNTVLEIGCGSGELLEICREYGWEVLGNELSSSAQEVLKAKNIDYVPLDFASSKITNKFDVILLFEVLEHVTDPKALLDFCRQALRQGGLLLGTTPNSRSINSMCLGSDWSIYGLPEHLNVFSPRGLSALALESGLDNSTLETRGFNPYDFILHIRKWKAFKRDKAEFSRVSMGQNLNSRAHSNKLFGIIKRSINYLFKKFHVGDSLYFEFVRG